MKNLHEQGFGVEKKVYTGNLSDTEIESNLNFSCVI